MKFLPATALILTASTATGQPLTGDAEMGRTMALEVCADCHNVVLSPEVERADAPRSFTAIAKDPVYTPTSLRVFLTTPHNQMPDYIFTREEQDNLIAYIMQIREKQQAE